MERKIDSGEKAGKRSEKINVIPLDDFSAKPANKEKSLDNQEKGSRGSSLILPQSSPTLSKYDCLLQGTFFAYVN